LELSHFSLKRVWKEINSLTILFFPDSGFYILFEIADFYRKQEINMSLRGAEGREQRALGTPLSALPL